MQDIEDLIMPQSEELSERRKRLAAVRRNFKKKEAENKSSEMIENQKLFRQRKLRKQNKQKQESDLEMVPKNDFCGSEHDNWQPDFDFEKPQKKEGICFHK